MECVEQYRARQPLSSALHRAVLEGLPRLVEKSNERGGLPDFVLDELYAYAACGDLSRGFVRVACPSCGEELKVGFSCKGRTVCPSCSAKRAALTAAHLVDQVLPRVPFRQWTLAFPRALKLALASEPAFLSEALHAFVRSIFAWQRRCARRLGVEKPRPGAVAFIQWFSTALLLHPHYHVLVPDGVFHGEEQHFAP